MKETMKAVGVSSTKNVGALAAMRLIPFAMRGSRGRRLEGGCGLI